MKKPRSGEVLGKKCLTADLIGYQERAVVSRTIIDRKSGTVTLFAFDRGQGLSEQSAPYDALAHVLDGRAEVRIDGVPHELCAGEMMVVPAEHPHAVVALTQLKMLLTMVRYEPEPIQIQAF